MKLYQIDLDGPNKEFDSIVINSADYKTMNATLSSNSDPISRIASFLNECAEFRLGDDKIPFFPTKEYVASLDGSIGAELMDLMNLVIIGDPEDYRFSAKPDGNGTDSPIIYEMLNPVSVAVSKNGEESVFEVKSLQFKGRVFGDMVSVLTAENADAEFRLFMRAYATIVSASIVPMTDSFVDRLDCRDVSYIRRVIIPLFTSRSRRFRKL